MHACIAGLVCEGACQGSHLELPHSLAPTPPRPAHLLCLGVNAHPGLGAHLVLTFTLTLILILTLTLALPTFCAWGSTFTQALELSTVRGPSRRDTT